MSLLRAAAMVTSAAPSANSATAAATASWKARLQGALAKNRSLANARYVQLATVRPDGRPANRTVVFRGFLGESTDITFVTDKRSSKVSEIAGNPWAEVAWYLPETREQFRLAGRLTVVGDDHADEKLCKARQHAWHQLSDAGRAQFTWPHPGDPRRSSSDGGSDSTGDDSALFSQPAPGGSEPALSTFCLVVMAVEEADHLQLRNNRRRHWVRQAELAAAGASADNDTALAVWTEQEVNP